MLKSLYHRLVPATLRYPLGRWRRFLMDTGHRLGATGPLPPRTLLRSVQMTPYIREYLEVGAKSAASIDAALRNVLTEDVPRVLDFGCGLGRTLRFLRDRRYELFGCDVHAAAIQWAASAFPDIRFEINAEVPPLHYGSATFDAIFAVSVFTHFDETAQRSWAQEMARCLRDQGVLVLTTMGPHALSGFPNLNTPERLQVLARAGFDYVPAAGSFNDNGAFHTAEGLDRLMGSDFELLSWKSGGLDGFQDLSVLRRRSRPCRRS